MTAADCRSAALTVGAVMSPDAPCVCEDISLAQAAQLHPNDPLPQALAATMHHQLWHLPVVRDDEPVGTLHLAGLLTLWPHLHTHPLPKPAHQAARR